AVEMLVFLVRRQRLAGPLIRLAVADAADQVLEVEAGSRELLGQVIEQRGMGVLRFRTHVIDRVDDATTEEAGPPAIDRGPGKERIIRRRCPGGELAAKLRLAGRRRLASEQELGLYRLALAVRNHD